MINIIVKMTSQPIDYGTIIGFTLFAISEIIPILPIPANGIFHSFLIGLHNSFKDPIKDIETGQQLINKGTRQQRQQEEEQEQEQVQEQQQKQITLTCQNCQSELNDIITYITEHPDKLKNIKDFIASQNI